MYNFDLDAYYTDAKLTYETRAEIERVADEVTKEGFLQADLWRLCDQSNIYYVQKQKFQHTVKSHQK